MIRSIDKERGDVSRSRFVLKLLEQVYEEKKQKNGAGSQDETLTLGLPPTNNNSH